MSFEEIYGKAPAARGWTNKDNVKVSSLSPVAVDAAKHLAESDDDHGVTCPFCGKSFVPDYQTDSTTSETGSSDPDADQDGDEPEYEDRKARLAAELGRQAAAAGQPKNVTEKKHSAKSRRFAVVDGVLTKIFD